MYPDTDRKAHREGDVRVRFFVNADGQVGRSQLLNNSGSKDMSDSALGALKGYRYDSNQAGWWEKTFHFSLNGNGEVYGGQLRR
jgi:TonB family protein